MRKVPLLAVAALALGAAAGLAAPPKGKNFRDCRDCPEMVSIPAGSFTMGVSAAEEASVGAAKGFSGRSVPEHQVSVRGFAIGKYPVTRGEFAAFVKATGRNTGDTCSIWKIEPTGVKFATEAGNNWRKANFPQTDRDPVVCVNWDDAKAYTAWLAKKTGRPYRLLSEAEWEYAARAGSTGPWYWGARPEQACLYENAADQAFAEATKADAKEVFQCRDAYVFTSPVGKYRPNAFGVHDMLGNVVQWVEDCGNRTYAGNPPTDGSPWLAGDCTMRGVRGTGSRMSWRYFRPGLRDWVKTDYRGTMYGFRVAMTQ